MRVYYDEKGDFLEISAGKPTQCYATEVEPGVFLRREEKTEEIKSIGILGFKKRSKPLKDIEVRLPVKITFSAQA
ncbi:hypothetical protein HYV82_00990 [Candidatus Woesearchaeota archaeon]|nr:hypothetical protein [Candidatus Woesearchaeota archaeon]